MDKIDQSQPLVQDDVDDRMREIVKRFGLQGRGKFSFLASLGAPSEESWKAWWHRRQRPTHFMIEAVGRRWPEYAFWLITGITDAANGHRSPDGCIAPERFQKPRKAAEDYFNSLLVFRSKLIAGQCLTIEDLNELNILMDVRMSESELLSEFEKKQS